MNWRQRENYTVETCIKWSRQFFVIQTNRNLSVWTSVSCYSDNQVSYVIPCSCTGYCWTMIGISLPHRSILRPPHSCPVQNSLRPLHSCLRLPHSIPRNSIRLLLQRCNRNSHRPFLGSIHILHGLLRTL